MSNKLYIIGNGFDRAHKLPTSYDPDFKRIADRYEPEYFWDLYQSCEPSIWAHFENLLGCPDFNFLQDIFDGYAPDYLSDRESDRDGIIFQVDLNGNLTPALYEFVDNAESALDNTYRDSVLEKMLDENGFYISFNYTHTLERLYDISSERILHVHGEAGKNNLLLGYTKGKFTPEQYVYDVRQKGRGPYRKLDIQDYIEEIEDYYIRTAYENLLDKCISFNKEIKTDLVNSFLETIESQIEEIIVYGHSCEIDYDYFDLLNRRYPQARWRFYVAGDEQQCNVKALIENYCIKDTKVFWVTFYNKLDYDEQTTYDSIVEKNSHLIEIGNLSSYIDPDIKIEKEAKIKNEYIRFGADGICGIKYLEKFLDATPEEKAKAYKLIRSKLVMWPRHRQSINVRRFQCFRDRLDFTIYDIQQYYLYGESRLVRKNSYTATFLDELESFERFIDEYSFRSFINENGDVKNLVSGEIITSYDEYEYSTEANRKYLQKLIQILQEENNVNR